MRFLLVASYADSILRFRGSLIKLIQSKGIQVHVAAPGLYLGSPIRTQLENMNVKVHEISLSRTGMNPLIDIKSVIDLWMLFAKVRPYYVLSYTIKPVIYTSLVARAFGVQNCNALITGLGYSFKKHLDFKGRLLAYITRRMYRKALQKVSTIFFQNPDDELVFKNSHIIGFDARSVIVNGSGIDTDEYADTDLPIEASFLLIARLIVSKGVREYAEAARKIKKKYPAVEISLVGWIDDNPDSISILELNSWVEEEILDFKGRLDDVRNVISQCSVFVLPSYSEGTPRTVLEAMSMGRAIITTNAPGCRETVSNGKNGILIPPRNVDALVEAMEILILNPNLIQDMGKESRKMAEQKYDVHKVNRFLLSSMQIK